MFKSVPLPALAFLRFLSQAPWLGISSPWRPHLGREVVPAIASTLAGLGVATTLAPLRATRLLVASLAKRSPNPGTGAGRWGPRLGETWGRLGEAAET